MLNHYHNFLPSQFHVHRMLDGMQVSNALNIDMAKASVIDILLVDWVGSVSYMPAKVEIQPPPSSG